jgi:hypothetical protein
VTRKVILFASLFFVALTSGGAFGVYLAYNPAGMSAAFYIETMQHGIRVMLPLAVVLNLRSVLHCRLSRPRATRPPELLPLDRVKYLHHNEHLSYGLWQLADQPSDYYVE